MSQSERERIYQEVQRERMAEIAKLGGHARAAKLSPAERKRIAMLGVAARLRNKAATDQTD